MSLPFTWPEAPSTSRPGRLTEIASFRKSSISEERFQQVFGTITRKVGGFPISRQQLAGTQDECPDIFVLVADWTSAEEKDVFEPGEEYQSVKPAFGELVDADDPQFQCHHMILPDTAATTPEAPYHVVSRMHIAESDHAAVAAAFAEYTTSLTPADGYLSIAVAPSREDPTVVVCLVAFESRAHADKAGRQPAHHQLKTTLDHLLVNDGTGVKYGAALKRVV